MPVCIAVIRNIQSLHFYYVIHYAARRSESSSSSRPIKACGLRGVYQRQVEARMQTANLRMILHDIDIDMPSINEYVNVQCRTMSSLCGCRVCLPDDGKRAPLRAPTNYDCM